MLLLVLLFVLLRYYDYVALLDNNDSNDDVLCYNII